MDGIHDLGGREGYGPIDVGEPPATDDRVRWFLHRRRVGVFAPVSPLYVGFQHRRAARDTTVDDVINELKGNQ